MADEKQSDKARREDLPKKEESSTGSGIDQNTTASASAPASTPGAFISAATSPYVNIQKALEAMFPYYREIIEPSLTAEDLTDNPLNIYNSNMRRNITSKYYNLQIPVYGFTVSEPKLLSLEECNTYSHYLPMYNYFALNGIQVPDKVYASNVRIPIMSDGGFATAPEVFDKKEKIQAANFINPLCFADGLYLADYTVIPKDRLVKVVFTDKNYQHGRIIGVGEYPNLLAESIQKYYPNLQIPFQGLLGTVGQYGMTGPDPNCNEPGRYRLSKGGCGGGGFTYSQYPILAQIRMKERSVCADKAKWAALIAEEAQKQIDGLNWVAIAQGAIMNAIFESGLKPEAKNPDGGAAGLFQLLPGKGEGAGFSRDSTGILATRRRENANLPSNNDPANPYLNAAFTISRFKQIPEILAATDAVSATRAIIVKFEKPAVGACLNSEANGRTDSIKEYFQ